MSFPVPKTALPGLRPLLDGSLWQTWASRGWVEQLPVTADAVGYIRLKPDTSCRLTIFPTWRKVTSAETTGSGDPCKSAGSAALPRGWRVELYPDAARAHRAHQKECGRADESFVDDAHAAVVVAFPQDRELRGLRHCAHDFRLRTALESSIQDFAQADWRLKRSDFSTRLMTYKPGRRAVMEIGATSKHRVSGEKRRHHWLVKLMKPSLAAVQFQKLVAIETLLNDENFAPVPAVCGMDAALGLVLIGWQDGRNIRRNSIHGADGPRDSEATGDEETLYRLGELLARVHARPVDPRSDPSIDSLPRATARRSLGQLAADYAALNPDLADRVCAAAAALDRMTPAEPLVPIHGDLHLGQVLDDSGECRLIDWDQAGLGYALEDLGSLLAHRIVAESPQSYADEFLEGYRSADLRAVPLTPEAIGGWTSRMLFLRLADGFRQMRPDWPERMESQLAAIEGWLAHPGQILATKM